MEREQVTWKPYDPCPCGCEKIGWKINRFGHVIGCLCKPCIGRRNREKGQRGQRRMHRALGGTGVTPSHEETARPYRREVVVMPESKVGGQIPASFDKFVRTDWFQRALDQSARAVPVGSGVDPAVVIRGDWLVVDIRRNKENSYLRYLRATGATETEAGPALAPETGVEDLRS